MRKYLQLVNLPSYPSQLKGGYFSNSPCSAADEAAENTLASYGGQYNSADKQLKQL